MRDALNFDSAPCSRRPARSHIATLAASVATLYVLRGAPCQAADVAQLPVPLAGPLAPDIAGALEKPDPSIDYKIVFDVSSEPATSRDVSPALVNICKLINSFRSYGVPADHLHITAVFHGSTILQVTTNEAYARRTGAPGNPNLAILKQVTAAGPKLVVCGRSALSQNYTVADLAPGVAVDLLATITFLNLQSRGYVEVGI